MSLVVKSFRIEKEIWDALVAEKQSPSRLIRLFILAGLHQMKIPHYDEILLLARLEEQARKVGVNTNQAVRALNTTLIKQQSLEEKTLRICSRLAVNFMRFGIKSTNFWRRIMANKRNWLDEHIRGIYVERQSFPLHYQSPAKQRATISFKLPPPEAVIKVAFYVKSPQGAKNIAHYIAHGSEGLEQDARVFDDERRLIPTEELNETIDAYDLKQRRKNGNAMVHLIVSFPKRMNVSEDEAYHFMERYMEPFAERGYRFLYAVHTHQSATHGHILLKMSNGRERLKIKKPQLQMLRQHQVEVAKEFGWEMQATRFQDRDFSLTQMIIPRKHKTIRQIRELHERRKSVKRTVESERKR